MTTPSEIDATKCPRCGAELLNGCNRAWVCRSWLNLDGTLHQSTVCQIAELTHTLATVTAERDLLATLLDQELHMSAEMVYDIDGKTIRRWRSGRVWVTESGAVFDTALAAIRAAMNETNGDGA